MKKILFLLLVTISSYAQTYQNPTFGTVTTKTNIETATANKISVQETDGKINWLQPVNIPIPIVPINYMPTATTLGGHLTGIDNKLGTIVATTAGVTTRVWFTADVTVVSATNYYTSNATSKGTLASAVQSVVNDDNQKKYFTQDIIGTSFAANTLFPAGIYAGNLSASTTPNSAQQRYTVELYKCDTNGAPIASGITGAPVGSLGVTVVTILDSGLLTLADGSVTNVQVSGNLASPLSMAVGERIRYHVSAEKVGTAASNITQSVYYGTSYNSYLDVPVPLNTTAVQNLSSVTGATTTDALNNLDANTIHKTLDETKTGNLNVVGIVGINTVTPVGNMTVFTGTQENVNIVSQQNGSISFNNSGALVSSPTMIGKSNDAPGLIDISATNNSNASYDRLFEVRENDDSDFSTITGGGFSFRRYTTELFRILRNGNSTLLGSLKSNNYTTDSGDYLTGTKSKTAIASFYNNKTVTAHANYGFLEDSDLNYASAGVQGHASFNDNIHIIGVQASDHHHSYQAYPHYGNSGILSSLKGFWMQPDVTAGTVTDLFEFEANNPLGAGTISNLVGLRIRELTRGATNYAIFTEGATPSFFNGNTYFWSKIGVGTLTPVAQLEVLDIDRSVSSNGNFTVRTTDAAGIDKGGFMTFGGSYSSTDRTVFAGIAGKKETATGGQISGYLAFSTSDNTLGNTEKMRLNSAGELIINNLGGSGDIQVLADNTGKLKKGAVQPLRYKALIAQTGTSAPTVTILENTLGTVTYGYTSAGVYTANSSGLFTTNKTYVSIPPAYGNGNIQAIKTNSTNIIDIRTSNGLTPTDGILANNILIEVYP